MTWDSTRTAIDSESRAAGAGALRVLRTRGWVVLLCAMVAGGVAFGLSSREQKMYAATSSLVFNNQQLSQQVSGVQPINSADPTAQQDTNVRLVQLGNLAQTTAAAVGHGLTGSEVRSSISVSAQGDTNVVNVTATASSPGLAAALANTYSEQFISQQKAANQKYIASALTLVERQLSSLAPSQRSSAQGLALQERAQSLAILGPLQGENVQLAQQAIPSSHPISPKVTRDTAFGIIFGLFIGFGLAFLRERADTSIRDPQDLQDTYQLPLLGVIPQSSQLGRGLSYLRTQGAGGPDVEAFRTLRAHLRYFNVDRELRTLLITSAAPGDGKTTVATMLAATDADAGARVVLVEADLRRPSIATALSLSGSRGLSDLLIGAASIDDTLHTTSAGLSSQDSDGAAPLYVIPAGVVPPNPSALLESVAMASLVEDLRERFDLVVIDTPPIGVVSDAISVMHQVDGIVLVGRVGRDGHADARRMREVLDGLDAPILGVVANGVRRGTGAYSYDYSYESSAPSATNGSDRKVQRDGSRS